MKCTSEKTLFDVLVLRSELQNTQIQNVFQPVQNTWTECALKNEFEAFCSVHSFLIWTFNLCRHQIILNACSIHSAFNQGNGVKLLQLAFSHLLNAKHSMLLNFNGYFLPPFILNYQPKLSPIKFFSLCTHLNKPHCIDFVPIGSVWEWTLIMR